LLHNAEGSSIATVRILRQALHGVRRISPYLVKPLVGDKIVRASHTLKDYSDAKSEMTELCRLLHDALPNEHQREQLRRKMNRD
jgi:hypothetical protein